MFTLLITLACGPNEQVTELATQLDALEQKVTTEEQAQQVDALRMQLDLARTQQQYDALALSIERTESGLTATATR